MSDYCTDQIKEKFKLVCRECGSENVLIHFEGGHAYSEYTVDPGSASVRCVDCDTDVVVYP